MDWVFDPDEYGRTRQVIVAGVTEDGGEATLDADGFYRWVRSRTGDAGRVVAQAVSSGFSTDALKWCYRNAVKENYPLHVPVPLGVEELVVTTAADLEPEEGELPAEEVG
jgi:predicted membrane-bound spermidine synthase